MRKSGHLGQLQGCGKTVNKCVNMAETEDRTHGIPFKSEYERQIVAGSLCP